MLELKIYLSEELDKRFRRIAMSIYGYGRGSLSKAAEEAFARWCSEHELSLSSPGGLSVAGASGVKTESREVVIDPDERQKPESPQNKAEDKSSVSMNS